MDQEEDGGAAEVPPGGGRGPGRGDDPFSKPKPDAHNALHICAELGVEPHNAIMVGDTPADTIMGQAANLGLTIGVLTGIGNKEDLTHADIIVHNVDEVVDLITPMYKD